MLNKEISVNVLRAVKSILPSRLNDDSLQCNKEYQRANEEYSNSFDSLRAKLDSEKEKELLEIEELINESYAIELDATYYKGMMDAIQVLKLLNVI